MSGLSIVCCCYGEGSCERRELLDMFSFSAWNVFTEMRHSEVEDSWCMGVFWVVGVFQDVFLEKRRIRPFCAMNYMKNVITIGLLETGWIHDFWL